MAIKHKIFVAADVIDPDYSRGEIHMVLYNASASKYTIGRGDWIGQLVFEQYTKAPIVEKEDIAIDTARGAGRFGSTGV